MKNPAFAGLLERKKGITCVIPDGGGFSQKQITQPSLRYGFFIFFINPHTSLRLDSA
jgi:hypothetical protein